MKKYIDLLNETINPIREKIINHEVYSVINSLEDLKIFSQHHIYAVWDFMSLLKSLQNGLTCTSVPWVPVNDGDIRYLINEIVVGEESDEDRLGNRVSHFEMYLSAMENLGADTSQMNRFLELITNGNSVNESLVFAEVAKGAANLVRETFNVIENEPLYVQAAVFTFGREDLIPDMFTQMVKKIANESPENMKDFVYYLDRHIEVDGGHHSHLALKMTSQLCGDDDQKWRRAIYKTKDALEARKQLWDGVLSEIKRASVNV